MGAAIVHPLAHAAEVARGVALAHVLPGVRVQGGAGAARLGRWMAAARRDPSGAQAREVAALLVDAKTVSRLVRSGAADVAQRRAARRLARMAGSLPPGLVPAALADRAVAAVGAVARLECLAGALTGPKHAAAVDRTAAELADAGMPSSAAAWPDEPLPDGVVSDARSAAVARAAAAALAECEPAVAAAAEVIAEHIRQRSGGDRDGRDAEAGVRRRLTAVRRERTERAGALTRRLLAAADTAAPSGGPEVWWSDPGLLAWLRGRTHPDLCAPAFEQDAARRWLGGDPFGLRRLPPSPGFLAGVPVTELPAGQVAPLLRRISLTRPAPAAEELSAEVLAADPGRVSVVVRGRRLRRWGQPPGSGAPLLPRRARVPHVVHGIWLGRALPAQSVFWRNYAAGAQRYAGLVDFVLWTDIPRERFVAADSCPLPAAGQPDPLAEVRALLLWARENGILLVHVFEVFHVRAPMRLHAQFALEMSKQLPRGYASASDHLRVEIIHRFGGLYADGDISFAGPETLPAFFYRLAGSVPGFTMNPLGRGFVNNDVVAAPARHPAIMLWLECARLNYLRSQPDLFGGVRGMTRQFRGPWRQGRYLAPIRTGRIHHRLLALLGIPADTLPATMPALQASSEGSWVPPAGGEPAAVARQVADDDHMVGVLARCLTFLQWQVLARDGNLYLSAVDPVIRGLPDPDVAWIALLSVLPAINVDLPPVTSVTDLRRNDDGGLEAVVLPPEAEALIDRTARPARWLGAPLSQTGAPVWLLEERVAPATLRRPAADQSPYAEPLARLAEVAVNALGDPIGVWIRFPGDARRWRHHPRFSTLPSDHVGIAFGNPHQDPRHLRVHPEALATLLLQLRMADRPVRLTVPAECIDATRPLADRLHQLLDQPVHLTEHATIPLHPQLPPVHHLPLTA